jgi:uncharacterized protein (TIGR03083 family)
VEVAGYLDALRLHGALLADAAGRAGLQAPVPPCSPWTVRDLLRHTGYVHRWAAQHITDRAPSIIDGPPEADILRGGTDDANLLDWFRAGHAALAETLAGADPALQCATFMPAPSPVAFWARRQAHETAIHRVDAESADGTVPEFPPGFAADGIDELIMGFGQRRKYRPSAPMAGAGLQVRTTDTGDAWHLTLSAAGSEGRILAHRGPGPGECVVSGPASGVYLFLWNRAGAGPRAGVTVTGDPASLAAWQSGVRVRWD